jgi:hypothetical protein
MGRPAHPSMTAVGAGPLPRADLDAIEVTQAVQDLGESVPLVANKRTLVRVYLGVPSGSLTVEGELRVRRKPGTPWIKVPSMGVAQLDGSRKGTTLADLRSRRDTLNYSLNFLVPGKLRQQGNLLLRLQKVREVGTGRPVQVNDSIGTRTATFVAGPPLRLRVINLRYTMGTPPVTHVPTAGDLANLQSWLRRAYPVPDVVFASVTVNANAAPPFTSGHANAQVAAIRALDMAGGGDQRTHYYGYVSDGGFFMRGSAAGIPGVPDPATVASGPTGSNTWGWDNDGSYGDWYGGHELGHTVGRFHPGFCGESADDPSYPFTAGQLANADDAFVGIDLGDATLGIAPVALPGTAWHDVMTYCPTQWLSSYTYQGVRDRLAAEAALFPGAVPAGAVSGAVPGDPLVHVAGVVNLTKNSATIDYVTPLPGPAAPSPEPEQTRAEIRTVDSGGEAQTYPVELRPDLCRLPDEDETALVDAILDVPEDATSFELLLDGNPIATFQVGADPGPPPENLQLKPAEAAGVAEQRGDEAPWTLSWEDAGREAMGVAEADNRSYVVQASTDEGATWITLAVGAKRNEIELDPTDFADAEKVRFRVLTTNGVSYSEATTDDLVLEEEAGQG